MLSGNRYHYRRLKTFQKHRKKNHTGKGTVVTGMVISGEISINKDVMITDGKGIVLKHSKVFHIEYGFVSKSPMPSFAQKGMNIEMFLKNIKENEVFRGNVVVIE